MSQSRNNGLTSCLCNHILFQMKVDQCLVSKYGIVTSCHRTTDFDVHCDLLDSVHLPGILPSESDSNYDSDSLLEDDSDGLADQEEWETVQTALVPSIPSVEPETDSPDTSALSPEPWESGDSQGTMGASSASQAPVSGLMSSAAASVMSLWRTATSQVDKR